MAWIWEKEFWTVDRQELYDDEGRSLGPEPMQEAWKRYRDQSPRSELQTRLFALLMAGAVLAAFVVEIGPRSAVVASMIVTVVVGVGLVINKGQFSNPEADVQLAIRSDDKLDVAATLRLWRPELLATVFAAVLSFIAFHVLIGEDDTNASTPPAEEPVVEAPLGTLDVSATTVVESSNPVAVTEAAPAATTEPEVTVPVELEGSDQARPVENVDGTIDLVPTAAATAIDEAVNHLIAGDWPYPPPGWTPTDTSTGDWATLAVGDNRVTARISLLRGDGEPAITVDVAAVASDDGTSWEVTPQ